MSRLDLTGGAAPLTLPWLHDEIIACERVTGHLPESVVLTDIQTEELCRRLARQQVSRVRFANSAASGRPRFDTVGVVTREAVAA